MRKKEHSRILKIPVVVLGILLLFIVVFTYLSLNLKSRNYGYQIQELLSKHKKLESEINKLSAKKESLQNLDRVENIAVNKLNYKSPLPEQFLKVYIK